MTLGTESPSSAVEAGEPHGSSFPRARGGDPRALLRGAGLWPKKRLGQNFLIAEPIARAIATACVPDSEVGRARVVEIGAGTGALTRWLSPRAGELVALEIDRDLAALLRSEIEGTKVRVLQVDATAVDLPQLLGPAAQEAPRVLCGNLPYSITGTLLRLAVESAAFVERAVFMVQEEVADRLTAPPGGSNRGALSVFVQALFEVRRVLRAAPGAFHPAPGVTSTVVELSSLRAPRARPSRGFDRLVRAAFQARRKTLRNAWARVIPDAVALERAAVRAGIDLGARGETLEVESFGRMAAELGVSDPDSAD